MRKLSKLSVFFGLLLIALSFTIGANAVSTTPSEGAEPTKQKNLNSNREDAMLKKDLRMEEKANARISKAATKIARLSEARLKLCQAKENVIKNRFKALLALGVKTHTGKEKIVARVDAFYNNVLVPKGYTLPNYDTLKADIAESEANVEAILEEAQANGQDFSCDSDDPKSVTDEFKQSIQELIAANKAYRASVRAFVVAVRDLAKEAKADTLSPSPVVSPETTPVVSQGPEI